MSDGPPAWLDDVPAPSGPPATQARGGKQQNSRYTPKPTMTKDETEILAAEFLGWLTHPVRMVELKKQLPSGIKPEAFVDAAKTAIFKNPKLLRPDLRPSLMMAIMSAAGQGLLPDGKEGALIIRSNYDPEARTKLELVCWQPMIWGIVKLGRETGAIRTIRANIVFHGEPFRLVQGDEDRIEHEPIPEIVEAAYHDLNGGLDQWNNPQARPDAFFRHIRAAYCVIEAMDGLRTKRWMTRERLVSLRETSRADKGPWNSRWIDEMILKGVILFTTKWINLDLDSASGRRFQAALLTDLNIDFEKDDRIGSPVPNGVGLIGHETKLDAFETLFGQDKKEKVPVNAEPDAPKETRPVEPERPRETVDKQPSASTAETPLPTSDPTKAPKEWRTVQSWALDMRKAFEGLMTLEEIQAYEAQPWFQTYLDGARKRALTIAQEVEDALEDRKTFVAQLPKEAE